MELVISTSSVVIALAALFVAYWQGHLSRKHNRLCVTPKLQMHTDQSTSDNFGYIELIIMNAGIGPGIIRTIQLRKNGTLVGELSNELVYAELKNLPIKPRTVRTGWIQPGYFMPEKERFSLIRIEFESADPNSSVQSLLEKTRLVFDTYAVQCNYESIYGDKFELDTTKENGGAAPALPKTPPA